MTLDNLTTTGIILPYTKDIKLARRLTEMGFVPGKQVKFVRTAFLGKTLEFRIDDIYISLRDTEARLVNIREE